MTTEADVLDAPEATEATEAAETVELNLLDQAIAATKQTPKDDAKDLLANLSKQVLEGTLTWDKNLSVTINKAVDQIDVAISKQVSAIMHQEKFQKWKAPGADCNT